MKSKLSFIPKVSLLLFSISLIIIFTSSRSGGVIDHFKIGDVVYSILKPDQFTKLHGSGWVLMDGRPIVGSHLQQFYSSQLVSGQNLPNANGQFIRSMNGGASASDGADPVKGRAVGSVQNQQIISHSHTFSAGGGSSGPRNAISIDTNPSTTITTSNVGGDETRPTNITLYTYIKINE
jgi:hypothetical protein